LDESIPGVRPYVLHGRFVDLFDPRLSVLTSRTLTAGSRVFLIDLETQNKSDAPRVIAASCRVTNEQAGKGKLIFDADGIADTNAVVRIQTANRPRRVIVGGTALQPKDYEVAAGTLLIRFQNSTAPLRVEIEFAQ
jgi:hypothetical protein